MVRPRLDGVLRTPTGQISRSRASLLSRGRMSHTDYVVYFAKVDDAVKIGWSGCTTTRMEAIQYQHGKVVRIIGTAHVPTEAIARKLERKMHEVHASKRVKGEWFDLTASDVLAALAMCRSIGIKTSGGDDAKADRGMLSGMAYAADHAA